MALARVAGCSPAHILFKHILPNLLNTIVVLGTIQLGGVIIFEASLSFLGLAAGPPLSSWGNMIAGDGRALMQTSPWLVIGPGVALSLTVLAFNFLGDAIRDTLDPRLRGR